MMCYTVICYTVRFIQRYNFSILAKSTQQTNPESWVHSVGLPKLPGISILCTTLCVYCVEISIPIILAVPPKHSQCSIFEMTSMVQMTVLSSQLRYLDWSV